jgi:DNA recombination protein RmuC
LRNERQNLAEKLALLESAKQTLANQFEALAADILEKKSKSFSEGSQKELGTC